MREIVVLDFTVVRPLAALRLNMLDSYMLQIKKKKLTESYVILDTISFSPKNLLELHACNIHLILSFYLNTFRKNAKRNLSI